MRNALKISVLGNDNVAIYAKNRSYLGHIVKETELGFQSFYLLAPKTLIRISF